MKQYLFYLIDVTDKKRLHECKKVHSTYSSETDYARYANSLQNGILPEKTISPKSETVSQQNKKISQKKY